MDSNIVCGKNIHIAYSTDRHFIRRTLVSILSAYDNLNKKDHLYIYVLYRDLNEFDRIQMRKVCNLDRLHFTFIFSDMTRKEGWEIGQFVMAAYYRLSLARHLPGLDKLIYLDGDTIVNHDISELWDTYIDDRYVGAVSQPRMVDCIFNREKYNFEIPPGENNRTGSFNSGVLLINLKRWREENLEEIFLKLVEQNKDIIQYADQDILNLYIGDKWHRLDRRWNVDNHLFWNERKLVISNEERKALVSDPFIIHYNRKPYRLHRHPLRHLYKDIVNKYNIKFWDEDKEVH